MPWALGNVVGWVQDAGIGGMGAGIGGMVGGMQESLISGGHHRQLQSGYVNQEVIKHWLFWNFPYECESKP